MTILRTWIAGGAVSAFLSVAIGAFGAHGLQLTGYYESIYQTGVQYHMMHALAILLVGVAGDRLAYPGYAAWAGRLFALGTLLFSGSLYTLSITEQTWLGAITPLGGVSFLAGWVFLLLAAIRKPK